MSTQTLSTQTSVGRIQHVLSSWGLLVILVGLFILFALLKSDTFLTAFTFNSLQQYSDPITSLRMDSCGKCSAYLPILRFGDVSAR